MHQPAASALPTIGWVEAVHILPERFNIEAKTDTGADHSSIDVVEWKSYLHNDQEWIRFKVLNNNGDLQVFERELSRYAMIKRKRAEPVKRPVIEMWLCIGKQKFLAPVNLSKRKDFKYRMLIGRSLLSGNYLVDSAAKRTLSPECAL